MQDKITILLATYNGENFLPEQLDSIINQTYLNWELWIRDDESTDSTVEIIKDYMQKDKRIKLYYDNFQNLGVVRNFGTLLENVEYQNYIMFSDQDDVWLPFKIEETLKKMKEEELKEDKPILVYSLFKTVNQDLSELNIKQNKQPNSISINHIISNNFIHGCTMMLNRKLVELVNPISENAENHDYWIALIAAYCGKISSVGKVTMLYRQHDYNVTGNHKNNSLHLRVNRLLSGKYNNLISQRIVMLQSLILHLQSKNINTSFLENYIENIRSGGYKAVFYVVKNKTYKYGTGIPANIMNIISTFTYKE